ncbi:MAG TPA: DUF6600 domain-containing protein [Vicinamibacterales bacterium]|jgi:hypothetical protein
MRVLAPIGIAFGVALFSVCTPAAFAQDNTRPPAHVSFVDGAATLDRSTGESERLVVNVPIVPGDRIQTTNGRVEVMFDDGSAIEIEPDSAVEFLDSLRVRILAGTVEHRRAAEPPVDSAAADSAQYLPTNLQNYATDLSSSGTWAYEASYGNVWYPTVATDWRPYYYGYWSSVPAYGWTWVGAASWAWPTHHYGRWGYAHSRWFWIPGPTYASAWVSWGTAPGYVSWCPLGYNGRPVAALSVGYRSAWNAWTVVPRDHFGTHYYAANRYAVNPAGIPTSTPFIVHRDAPTFAGANASAASARSRSTAAPVYANRPDNRPATFNSSPRANVVSPRTGVVGANSSYVRPTPGTAVPRNPTAGGFNTQPATRSAAPLYQSPRTQSPIRPVQPRPATAPQVQQFRSAPAQPSSPSHERSFSHPAPSAPAPSSHANTAAPRGHSSGGASSSAPRRR